MKCPGQDTRYWKPGDIFELDCPHCGHKVEFFKDEATRKCRNCRNSVANPKMDFGCANYCKYAAECLGELGPELLAKRTDLLKDRVAVEVKRRMGHDFAAIAHAIKVAQAVEKIATEEKADLPLVLCAAYLHALASGSPGDPADNTESEVQKVLIGLGAPTELIHEVIDMLRSFNNGQTNDSVNVRVLSDAHLLAARHEAATEEDLLTSTGKKLWISERGEKRPAAGCNQTI